MPERQDNSSDTSRGFTPPPPFYNTAIFARLILPPVIGLSILALLIRYVIGA
jgi:hypothetical protein